jgi:three-Cys-motif partner protein
MARKPSKDYAIAAEPDGLPVSLVRHWAVEKKYRRIGMYAEIFATGMKNRWQSRVYIDLFAGAGYSQIKETGRLVYGSPLIALSLPDPFDRYIFCDKKPENVSALELRSAQLAPDADVHCFCGDVNDVATRQKIISHIPAAYPGFKVLSLCFMDPWNIGGLRFHTIRGLARGRSIDFLILLALGMDANRNMQVYARRNNGTIERFLDDPGWRERWGRARAERLHPVRFLADRFSAAMTGLGFKRMPLERMYCVRSDQKNLRLYYLALFSRHSLALRYWDQVLRYSEDQLSFM